MSSILISRSYCVRVLRKQTVKGAVQLVAEVMISFSTVDGKYLIAFFNHGLTLMLHMCFAAYWISAWPTMALQTTCDILERSTENKYK